MRRRLRDTRRCGNAFVSRCSLLCLSIALIVSSARLVSGQRWPVAQDANLRRITVSNDDGDVYVESSGDGSEIVLKTEKVRITDGDVYCGTSNVGLSAQIDALETNDNALDERIDTLNDTQIGLRDDLDALETSTSGRLTSIDTTLTSLASTDASLAAADASLSSRIDALNATDAQLKATDETLQMRTSSLNATDAVLKGVDDDLSSRIDALRDIYVNELNVTDKQLIVTDATLGSRIDDLNATQNELKSADAALSSRIATLEAAHTEYERIDDEVASLIDALNATDATMQATDASLSDRIDALNSTAQALSSEDASLSAQITSLMPPKCTSPGGTRLHYDGENWTCTCASGWSGTTCETTTPSLANLTLPTLAHWFDFSRLSQSNISSLAPSDVVDLKGNATDIEVIGTVSFELRVQNGLGAIYFDKPETSRTMRFRSTLLGRNPEVFVVFRVVTYSENGVIIGDVGNGYSLGTYKAGEGFVSLSRSSGTVMVKVAANYSFWHLAHVYFGENDGDGFLQIDSGERHYFGISGKYLTSSHSRPEMGAFSGDRFDHMVEQYVGEVAYFSSALTEEQRNDVRNILLNKWDIKCAWKDLGNTGDFTKNQPGHAGTVVGSLAECKSLCESSSCSVIHFCDAGSGLRYGECYTAEQPRGDAYSAGCSAVKNYVRVCVD